MAVKTANDHQTKQGNTKRSTDNRPSADHHKPSNHAAELASICEQALALAERAAVIGAEHLSRQLKAAVIPEGFDYGADLKSRRQQAELSQQEVADAAGISLQTYRNAECAYRPPTTITRSKIESVTALRLSDTEPKWWHGASFDPLGLLRELRESLAKPDGSLPVGALYFDPAAAEQYSAITRSESYNATIVRACPLADAAKAVAGRIVGKMDLVFLGSGDASQESRFGRLIEQAGKTATSVIAMDISQPLLSAAYTRLVDDMQHSSVYGMLGDIRRLRDYKQLTYRGAATIVVTLFGKTFSNLQEHETLDALGAFPRGTLLVLDVNLARGVTEPEIRKQDEAYVRGVPPSLCDFLTGPILRHKPGVRSCELKYELAMDKSLPGCYSLDAWATVDSFDGSRRRYRVAQFKRYALATLLPLFASYGWSHVATHPYLGEHSSLATLLTFARGT